MNEIKFPETELSQKWDACICNASPQLKEAAGHIVNAIGDYWPDSPRKFNFFFSDKARRLYIPRLIRSELSTRGWKDDAATDILESIHSLESLRCAADAIDRICFDLYIDKKPESHRDDPWNEPAPSLPPPAVDLRCLSSFLNLLSTIPTHELPTRAVFSRCSLCPRMFKTAHLGRRCCLLHSPKKNRPEYDRAKKLRRRPSSPVANNVISSACRRAASASDINLLMSAFHYLPSTAPILNGLENVDNFYAGLRFIIRRLDALDYPGTENELISHLMHSAELAKLLLMYEAHTNAYVYTQPQKKRGIKPYIDPILAKQIWSELPEEERSYQKVADILAQDHKIFVLRQSVHKAMKKQLINKKIRSA